MCRVHYVFEIRKCPRTFQFELLDEVIHYRVGPNFSSWICAEEFEGELKCVEVFKFIVKLLCYVVRILLAELP